VSLLFSNNNFQAADERTILSLLFFIFNFEEKKIELQINMKSDKMSLNSFQGRSFHSIE
jgi:hypothetical protein